MNLVTSILVLKNPKIAEERNYHGLSVPNKYKGSFKNQTIVVQADGIFPKFYEWYFGIKPNIKIINVFSMFGYCSDIAYQLELSGKSEVKLNYCLYAQCVDDNNKTAWSLIGIPNSDSLLNYPKTFNNFIKNFEKIVLPKNIFSQVFKLDAYHLKNFDFFQSKIPKKWLSDHFLPVSEIDVFEALKNTFQFNYFPNNFDFVLSLPYKRNIQLQLDETMAIYLIMFYLSNVIRYKPQYLEGLFEKKEAWLIDSFVKFCPTTFLRSIISRIIGTDFIIERR